ncbi:MAG: JAB domain-containing protein [Verrucomicrobiota bacterium]
MRVYEARLSYEATLFEVGHTALSKPEQVYDSLKDTLELHPMHEVFYVVFLNRKNKPLARIAISSGTVDGTLVHPRDVFRPAILAGASAIICAHNHPSGDPAPRSPCPPRRERNPRLTQFSLSGAR